MVTKTEHSTSFHDFPWSSMLFHILPVYSHDLLQHSPSHAWDFSFNFATHFAFSACFTNLTRLFKWAYSSLSVTLSGGANSRYLSNASTVWWSCALVRSGEDARRVSSMKISRIWKKSILFRSLVLVGSSSLWPSTWRNWYIIRRVIKCPPQKKWSSAVYTVWIVPGGRTLI